MRKYHVVIQKAEITDNSLGLALQVIPDNANGLFHGNTPYAMIISVNVNGQVCKVAHAPRITMPLSGAIASGVFVLPLTRTIPADKGNQTASVSVMLGYTQLSIPNNGILAAKKAFTDPVFLSQSVNPLAA